MKKKCILKGNDSNCSDKAIEKTAMEICEHTVVAVHTVTSVRFAHFIEGVWCFFFVSLAFNRDFFSFTHFASY